MEIQGRASFDFYYITACQSKTQSKKHDDQNFTPEQLFTGIKTVIVFATQLNHRFLQEGYGENHNHCSLIAKNLAKGLLKRRVSYRESVDIAFKR